ncbi:MAG: hypothetical protein CSA29_05230 [Desulfobacterales bacterium]|nr:MAG: hypothetical protein CSA29_05230 [Desulfobacterales bacterium]
MEPNDLSANWEQFIKILFHRLDIPSMEDIRRLNARLDNLEQLMYRKRSLESGKKGIRPKRKKSASAIVLEIIGHHPDGTDFKTIKAATGFDDKKLRNIIFRLFSNKKIERVKRGVYRVL